MTEGVQSCEQGLRQRPRKVASPGGKRGRAEGGQKCRVATHPGLRAGAGGGR
jgi:hypothetical protein